MGNLKTAVCLSGSERGLDALKNCLREYNYWLFHDFYTAISSLSTIKRQAKELTAVGLDSKAGLEPARVIAA